jgi:hypothetical protein
MLLPIATSSMGTGRVGRARPGHMHRSLMCRCRESSGRVMLGHPEVVVWGVAICSPQCGSGAASRALTFLPRYLVLCLHIAGRGERAYKDQDSATAKDISNANDDKQARYGHQASLRHRAWCWNAREGNTYVSMIVSACVASYLRVRSS